MIQNLKLSFYYFLINKVINLYFEGNQALLVFEYRKSFDYAALAWGTKHCELGIVIRRRTPFS
jgi:hypothetical protein